MHPNVYLRTFWRTQFKPEVFVAMSFAEPYRQRFADVIEPAIKAATHNGMPLGARRVDLSKSGDSILSDIVDGIAHSTMILADISVVGYDSKTGQSYRNGNVMYEVGLALACRQPSEVLLVRDDKADFLFDVSTVPHKHIDFSDAAKARAELTDEIEARLREIDHVKDARLDLAVSSLKVQEHQILATFAKYRMDQRFWLKQRNLATLAAIPRLLDKQLIRTVGVTDNGQAIFAWTQLGRALANSLSLRVPVLQVGVKAAAATSEAPDPTGGAA